MLDTLEQVVPDQVAGGGFEPETGPQPRRLDVGTVAGLLHPGPRRIVGAAPAVLVVEGVAERIERLPPTRRRDVEAPPGIEVAPSGQHMHVSASAAFAVQHGGPGVAVGLQSSPGRLLEGVQDRLDLSVGRFVLRRPRDHAGGVLVLEVERVGHRGHHVRVPPQHLDALARLPGRVPLAEPVPRARNLMCIVVRALEASQRRERPFDGDQVADHLDGLDRPRVGISPPGDLVEVVPDARDLPRALALDLGVRHGPGARPADRPAHQIRQRQACGARLGVPLRTLRVAGADLHPNGATGAHGAPFPCRGSEGAQPPASPSGGHAKCGHGG